MLDFLLGCYGWQPAALKSRSEGRVRFWLWFCKFPLFILAGVTCFRMRQQERLVTDNPPLQHHAPYVSDITTSLRLPAMALLALFPWTAVSAVLLYWTRKLWFLAHGLVDLGLLVPLLMGLILQDKYVPNKNKVCPDAASFQPNPETGISWFTLAAQLDTTTKDASALCREFAITWDLAIGCLFFLSFAAYSGILCDGRPRSILHVHRPATALVSLVFSPIGWLISGLRRLVIPQVRFSYRYTTKLVRCRKEKRPIEIPPAVAYNGTEGPHAVQNEKFQRILSIEHVLLNIVDALCYEDIVDLSLTSRAVREAVFPCHDLYHRVPKLKARCCSYVQPPKPPEVISTPAPLSSIFASMNLTSAAATVVSAPPAVPLTLLPISIPPPAHAPASTTAAASTSSSSVDDNNPTEKRPCPYCNRPICNNCQVSRSWAPLTAPWHLEGCDMFCKACYRALFTRRPRPAVPVQGQAWRRRGCVCTLDAQQRWCVGRRISLHAGSGQASSQPSTSTHTAQQGAAQAVNVLDNKSIESHDMCRSCAARPQDEVQGLRLARYRVVLRDIASGDRRPGGPWNHKWQKGRPMCSNCSRILAKGAIWWVCRKCGGECRDPIHPSWVGSKRPDEMV